MTFYVRMALRNIFRSYGRTTLSMLSIVFGVAIIILGRGFIRGTKENIVRAQVDTFSGHVMAVPGDYPKRGLQNPVDHLLELDDADRKWLDENSQAWTERLIFVPRAVRGPDAIRLRAFGFDPSTDESVFPRDAWVLDGTIPESADDGVLISRGVARLLSLEIGQTFVLESRTSAGALNALEVKVAGVLATGNPMFDRIGIFVPKPLTQELVRSGEAFSHLCVRLKRREASARIAAQLQDRLGDRARVTTWFEESEDVLRIQDIRQTMLDIIAFAILAIAATGIANTVLMAAYERVREIGTLRAMGMTRGGVVGLFVTEGVIMGIVGSTLGAALGGWLNWKLSIDGIDLSPMIEQVGDNATFDQIPFSPVLYTENSIQLVLVAVAIGLSIATVASFYPAIIASKLPPAEAVRS